VLSSYTHADHDGDQAGDPHVSQSSMHDLVSSHGHDHGDERDDDDSGLLCVSVGS